MNWDGPELIHHSDCPLYPKWAPPPGHFGMTCGCRCRERGPAPPYERVPAPPQKPAQVAFSFGGPGWNSGPTIVRPAVQAVIHTAPAAPAAPLSRRDLIAKVAAEGTWVPLSTNSAVTCHSCGAKKLRRYFSLGEIEICVACVHLLDLE